MRSFLAALEICVVTSSAVWAMAPYREPMALKDQAQIEASVAVDRPTMANAVPARVHVASLGVPPFVSPMVDDDLRRAPVSIPIAEPHHNANLLIKARKYIGTNPTGWAHLWCAKFMAMIAPDLAKKVDNPNWARDWADLPKAKHPKPGVIVVLKRGRGGHIGVLARFDRRGNPVIVSGNHGHRVAESVYPKSRVIAYVSPG